MSEICQIVGIIALTAAFFILLITKLGIRDEIVARAPKLISKLFACDFCLSFWMAEAFCTCLALLTGDYGWLIIPIFSAPLTRIII